jgi:hypothetical protein
MSGLFQVTDYVCENPLGEVESCPVMRYLEIAPGTDFGIDESRRVIAYWYADDDTSANYSSQVWDLGTRCTEDGRLLVEKSDSGETTLKLRGTRPFDYEQVSYTDRQPRKLMFRVRASLHQIARTPEHDSVLPRIRD